MRKVRASYGELMARVAILGTIILTLVGLNGLLSGRTSAQGATREIDLQDKLKNKRFTDGRRVVVETLVSGEKIVAEIKNGEFLKWFLLAADGTETQAVVRKRRTTTVKTATCMATVNTTTATTENGNTTGVTKSTTTFQIPCPPGTEGTDTFTPPKNSNSNSNSNSNTP